MIDKPLLQKLRAEINAALEAVGVKHNVRLSVGNAVFTPAEATFKLYAAAKDADGKVYDKDAERFKTDCRSFGFTPEHLGKSFITNGGRIYSIVGLQPRRRKYPIVCREEASGKKLLFSENRVLASIAA